MQAVEYVKRQKIGSIGRVVFAARGFSKSN